MISIAMLTCRHPDYVGRISEALGRQEDPPYYEVVLIDNGGCRETQRIGADRNWRVITPGYNTSYAEGHNLAAKEAVGEYLLQLNDDVIPEPGFLAALWRHRDAADIIGALQLDPDGRVNHAGGYIDRGPWPRHAGRWEPGDLHRGRGIEPCAWVTGAVLLMKREYFLGLGGFDEAYHYGCEDFDFCARAVTEYGARIAVNRDAVSIHGELGTRAGGADDRANEARLRERWGASLPHITARARANWSV